ncbi:TPA: hypothetical protein L5624_005109 [Pseudomonas aeruginosa]|nr:hypothetical protein [Pseudomonas aeruginosa]HBP4982087.1 hypothetical protein [Pseudomonas aeruginosa]
MSQLPIPLPLNESRWRYVTASGGGMTVAFLAGSGGSITLLSPEGENVSFRYGGAVAEIVTGAGNGRRRFRTGMDRFFPNKPIHSFEVSCLCPG